MPLLAPVSMPDPEEPVHLEPVHVRADPEAMPDACRLHLGLIGRIYPLTCSLNPDDHSKPFLFVRNQTRVVWQMARNKRRVAVIGSPGIGKSFPIPSPFSTSYVSLRF